MYFTHIILDKQALSDNINYYFNNYHKKIMAVLKNNAYGHGLLNVAKLLDPNPLVSHFLLTDLREAIYLRKNKIQKEILILNSASKEEFIIYEKYNITMSLTSYEQYLELVKYNYKGKIHLAINTSFNRLGISPNIFSKIINSNLNIIGIYTHLPLKHLKKSYNLFLKTTSIVKDKNYLCHYATSLNSSKLDLTFSTHIRLGLALYGLTKETHQVLTLKAKIANIIKVKKGVRISYEQKKIRKNGYLVIINLGYGDGIKKHFKLKTKEYQIIGSLTMNFCYLFMKSKPSSQFINIFSNDIPLEKIAKKNHLSPYELIASLNPKIIRKLDQK